MDGDSPRMASALGDDRANDEYRPPDGRGDDSTGLRLVVNYHHDGTAIWCSEDDWYDRLALIESVKRRDEGDDRAQRRLELIEPLNVDCDAEATASKAYDDAEATASEAYAAALAPARRAYDDALAPVRKAYDDALATARRAYDDAEATARKAYADAVKKAHRPWGRSKRGL